MSLWKILAWGSWNFELVQLFLLNWIVHCFARHAWCSPSVLFRDGKFLLGPVGILSLYNYSWSIGVQIVLEGTHGKFLVEAAGISSLQLFFINWIAHCFARHAWCSPSVLFRAGKFLLGPVGILSLYNYSWSIGVQIVLEGTHGKFLVEAAGISSLQLFFINWIAHCFAGKILLEVVGILSLRNYSWSIGFHIVVLGTHGVLRLFYFVMENACLRQLEFWACANINHLNTSLSFVTDVTSDKIIVKKYF